MPENNRFVCTVVSLVPFEIKEEKPGLIPGYFRIPASDGKNPVCLVVEAAKHNVYLDETRGSLPVQDASDQVARSIVEDFLSSQLGISDGVHPGLFWLVGSVTPEEVVKNHGDELRIAKLAQQRWFIEICKIADNDWNRRRQHNSISDFQRKAAELLGYTKETHEWMAPSLVMGSQTCPACNSVVSPGIAICPNCRCILDKEKYSRLEFATKG